MIGSTGVEALISSLAELGVELWCEGECLRVQAAQGALNDAQGAFLSSRREEVIAKLRGVAAAQFEELPLSLSQFVMWFQHQQAPASSVCTVGFLLRARGRLDQRALRHAVQALVDRHAVLRTTYHLRGETLVQRVAGAAVASLDVEAWAPADAPAGDASAPQIAAQLNRPFDLEHGPVFRATLFTDGAGEHRVLVTFHHIAADGWSSQVMISELQALYGEAATNVPPALPRPPVPYGDFVRWQAAELDGQGSERQWSYWRNVLAAPRQRTVLPTEVVRPAVPRFSGAAIRWDLHPDLVTRIQALAARLRTTQFVVLFGGFQLLLARLCGVRDVTTGMPVLGRPNADFMSIVGNFINVLPVRSWLDETMNVGDFLLQLRSVVVGALQMQHFPLPRMVQRLHLSGEETGQALFNTSFSLLTPEDLGLVSERSVAGTLFSLQPLALQAGLLDLGVDIVTSGTGMHCFLKYSLDVLTAAAADDVARQYEAMINAMIDFPDQPLSTLLGASTSAASDDVRAAKLLSELAVRDITLGLDGERLRVNAPKGALDEPARRAIAAQRPAILARLRAAGAEEAAREFWRVQLEGTPAVLALPTDRPRAVRRGKRFTQPGQMAREVPGGLLDSLRRVGEANGASLFVTLMAAWQILLHRYSGQDDIVVGTSINAAIPTRDFTNAVPIRGRFAGNPAFDRFLGQIRGVMLAAEEHTAPLVTRWQVTLDWRVIGDTVDGTAGTAGAEDDVLDIALVVGTPPRVDGRGASRFSYRYSADRFDADTIERLHDNFCTLIGSIVADPQAEVLDLPVLGPAERRRRLFDGGANSLVQIDCNALVHQLLEQSARQYPENIAVSGPDGDLRYDELDARANQLAHFLLDSGLRVGDLVAVCAERTAELPIALAAVLKAGCAYVPLDPTQPRERLRGLLRESRAVCLITTRGFAELADEALARVIRLDADGAAIAAGSTASPIVAMTAADLAYVIYTSGSTGRPKGVEVEHRNLVAFLAAMRLQPGLSANDVLLAVTTVAFDIAGLELWLPLSVGARIVLATRAEAVDGSRLAALLEAQAVTVMQATPATWRLLLDSGWSGRPELRALCGGEALPQALAAPLVGHADEVWNLYGPTETTIWSTMARVTAAAVSDSAPPIPIGRPIANTLVRIEDRAGEAVPAGVIGELLIGGAGVARGYRDQPELTAQAFVMRTEDGIASRWYRTGDLARLRNDGQLEFAGRRDHQIKLRGYRIEPGEIELRLAAHPGVTGSVVIVRHANEGDDRLVAYVTVADGMMLDPDALRASLRMNLPDYMVPNHVVVMAKFPLTPNGKLDRNALPAPDVMAAACATAAAPPLPEIPMTPAQQRVAVLWQDALGGGRVGLNDNFFDVGGHSLLLVKIQAGLKREFGCELPLVELFQYTTVAQQAHVMERRSHG